MGEVYYRPLIEDMVWSYSRIKTFDDCPYRWLLKYIKGYHEQDMFYASYGKFMHKLIEEFYNGNITKDEMLTKFLFDFSNEVKGERPSESIIQKYIERGCEYLAQFQPFPFKTIGVEKKVEFDIDGIPLIGFIDYLGEEGGEYVVVDNKSRDLKPRSNRKKPTVKDMELDDMLKQLYIYSAAVKKEYGKFPKYLCFNCFKSGVFIKEQFNEGTYNEAVQWLKDTINSILESTETSFTPRYDYFMCRFICGLHDDCDYYELFD